MVFGVYIVFKNILVTWGDFPQNVSNITSRIFLAFVAIFAINSVFEYNKRVSPIFFSSNRDIKELDSLKERLKEDDFVLTYWDYGWPLWYYLNRNNTLIDNGKHQQDNFIVSKILLSSNQTFSRNSSIFFIEKYIEGREKGFFRVMDYFVKNYPIEYLDKLKKPDFKLPKSKRDIYILLHKNMISTLATIESDSNIDLKTGKSYGSSYMDMGYLNKKFDSSQKELETFDGFKIDIEKGVIKDKQNSTNFRKIVVFEDGKIEFEKSYITSKREYLLIYQGKVLFMKPKLYNSFLIQALLFGNYNRDYFTEISKTDNFLILKINRGYN
jgi:dolichyl-diphosphooligosaccharide--protein glycosyltransferase/undecaprenyl-diphosphooligosaccharide--protein glycosyltransferase